jgi:hypothetical protein
MGVQILFAIKVVIHRTLGDPGDLDHPVQRGVMEAMSGELVERGAQDRVLLALSKSGEPWSDHGISG